MAQQQLDYGTVAGDGTGEDLFTTFKKTDDNFNELYGRTGFFDYNDLATATTPITITGGAGFISLTNDELGAFTNKTYAPSGVTDVWDAIAGSFDWTELDLGDTVDLRLDLEFVTTTTNTQVDVDLFLGTGGGAYQVPFVIEQNFKASGTFKSNRFNGIYMGDANTLNNGGVFKMKSDKTCTVKVNGWYCRIIRRYF